MVSISNGFFDRTHVWLTILLLALVFLLRQNTTVRADDCDNLGRIVHVGLQANDDRCTLRSAPDGHATKRLEDKFDYDYFLFYIGYDADTPINQLYKVTLTDTQLTRPKIVVGTFYDDASVGNGQTATEFWYSEHGASLGGMTIEEFQKMVTMAPNLLHDGVYDYVDGEIVVVQESSGGATRLMFSAVPVGTNLGTNTKGEHWVTFTPPDRDAYLIMVSNYNPTRRKGILTGSYKVIVSEN